MSKSSDTAVDVHDGHNAVSPGGVNAASPGLARVVDNGVRSITSAVIAVVCAVALCACSPAQTTTQGPTASPSPSMEPAPVGLTASLVQYRRDQPRRYVEVKLDNQTGGALDITLLGVTLSGYERPRDVHRTTHLETDRRVDLPVALADPICERPPDGTASATLRVEAAGRPAVRTTVDVDDDGLLERLHQFDCAVRRAETAFDLNLSPSWQRRGAGPDLLLRGQASARLRDQSAIVEITGINGGVLFVADAERTDPPLPVRLDRQRPSQTLAFNLVPARCDGHAIAESKRLTAVFFAVSIDGAEPVTLRRVPDDAGYQTLVAALRERCGLD